MAKKSGVKADARQDARTVKGPVCQAPSCNKPTHDGKPGFCTRFCRSDCERSGRTTSSDYGSFVHASPEDPTHQKIDPPFYACVRRSCPCSASFSGKEGDYCCKRCKDGTPCKGDAHSFPADWPQESRRTDRDAGKRQTQTTANHNGRSSGSSSPSVETPSLDPRPWQDWKWQQVSAENLGLCAFYFPGKETRWDTVFGCSFLGNFYPAEVRIKINEVFYTFRNAEAAFQALKFPTEAYRFVRLDGWQAFSLKKELEGRVQSDEKFGGCGSNWAAMLKVLRTKFEDNKNLQEALQRTGNAFLLEHNSCTGRDWFWSDNGDGSGMNALGLQLMLIRSHFRRKDLWSKWWKKHVDWNNDVLELKDRAWQDAVQRAADAVLSVFPLHSPRRLYASRGEAHHESSNPALPLDQEKDFPRLASRSQDRMVLRLQSSPPHSPCQEVRRCKACREKCPTQEDENAHTRETGHSRFESCQPLKEPGHQRCQDTSLSKQVRGQPDKENELLEGGTYGDSNRTTNASLTCQK